MAAQPIVVGTDGSPSADIAVEKAGELALALGAPVHIVTSYAPTSAWMAATGGIAVAELVSVEAANGLAEQVVARAGVRLANAGVEVHSHVCSGEPAQALIVLALDVQAQMIVVGHRGMSGARRVLGSVPNRVSHHAPCSVLIVPTR
jgi:nucleotide-binding universal stress UspA family protein